MKQKILVFAALVALAACKKEVQKAQELTP
jgi:hypothetical protein